MFLKMKWLTLNCIFIVLVILFCCFVVLLFSLRNNKIEQFNQSNHQISKPSIIFTCSTFFGKPNKLNQFLNAMNSIQQADIMLIDKFVVINEFDSDTRVSEANFSKIVNDAFPFVEFIQKEEVDSGQARTMNTILKKIKGYDFWIHWEESWIVTNNSFHDRDGLFVQKAIDVMKREPSLSQLQFTPDWSDIESTRILHKEGYALISPHPTYTTLENNVENYDKLQREYGMAVMWPLYSLRPSMNRVSFLETESPGSFQEEADLWPVKFEYDYGVRWLAAGAVKGIIEPPIAERQEGHKSTYTRY